MRDKKPSASLDTDYLDIGGSILQYSAVPLVVTGIVLYFFDRTANLPLYLELGAGALAYVGLLMKARAEDSRQYQIGTREQITEPLEGE